MSNYSIGDVVLVRYPFSDLSTSKIRPAVIISVSQQSQDVFIVPLTSKTESLLPGEFVLADWRAAGLHVASAVKRGIYTVHREIVTKAVGTLSNADLERVRSSLREWLDLSSEFKT